MKLLPINTQKEDSTPNNVKQIPNIYLLTTSSVLVTGIVRAYVSHFAIPSKLIEVVTSIMHMVIHIGTKKSAFPCETKTTTKITKI